MNHVKIYIPTKGRSESFRKHNRTLTYIPTSYWSNVYLFVEDSELVAYEEAILHRYGLKALDALNVVTLTEPLEFLPQKYNSMTAYAHLKGHDKVIFMDDDLQFFHIPLQDNGALQYWGEDKNGDHCPYMLRTGAFYQMMNCFNMALDYDVPLVGIGQREFAQDNRTTLMLNKRIYQVLGVHIPTLIEKDLLWTAPGITVLEDYLMILRILDAGLPILKMCNFIHNEIGDDKEGGCIDYRSKEVNEANGKALRDLFPDNVFLVHTKNRIWGEYVNTQLKLNSLADKIKPSKETIDKLHKILNYCIEMEKG